jgi:hypothetical protein
MRKNRVFIISLASLVPGTAFTLIFLSHFGWYLRRSTIVQVILAVGLGLFSSAIVFSLYYLINKWLQQPFLAREGQLADTRAGRIGRAIDEIKQRLPYLTKLEEAAQPKRWHWVNILILSVIPVVLALVNREWLFTITGEDDPWRYIGLGYYYFKDPSLYSGNYKVSRVPWILIEYTLRSFFSPANAEIILGLSFTIIGATGFYLLVSRIFDRRTGFITSALLSTYSYYLVSRSVDYHNLAGSVFLIWSLYFLTLATQPVKNQWVWFLATGFVFGVAAHSEFFVLGCFPALVVQFLMFHQGNKRSIRNAILFSLFGFLAATFLFGIAAVLSGRNFFFFLNQINFVESYAELFGTNGYRFSNGNWPLSATHLALPVAAFLFATGWLFRNSTKFLQNKLLMDRRKWLLTCINLQFFLIGIIWLIGEISQREALLNYYFVNPVYIYAFLVFAGFLAVDRRDKISLGILGIVPVVVISSLAFSNRIFPILGSRIFPSWPILQPLLFYLVIFACLILFRPRELVTLSMVVLMGLGNVMGMYTGPQPIFLTSSQISLDKNQCHMREDGYLSAIDTAQRLWGWGWNKTHLWWDASEGMPVTQCFDAQVGLANIGLSVTRMGIQKMKDSEPTQPINKIPQAYYEQVSQQKDVVAVITNNPATENQMLAELRNYGNWALAKQETITHGEIRYSLYIFSQEGKTP